jgi:hypothetical protein
MVQKAKPKQIKKKVGRPSRFNEMFFNFVTNLCLLGADDEMLMRQLEIGKTTLQRWKTGYPEFRAAIKKGREEADAKVGKSLYQRACGYSHEEDKIFCNAEGLVTKVKTIKHYPPDLGSMVFWLKNRNRTLWRDKHDVEVKVDDLSTIAEAIAGSYEQRKPK